MHFGIDCRELLNDPGKNLAAVCLASRFSKRRHDPRYLRIRHGSEVRMWRSAERFAGERRLAYYARIVTVIGMVLLSII